MSLRRALWLLAGGLSLALGIVGIVLPLLPTTPFVLLAAACFSRGSRRWENWLLEHARFGPLLRDWRTHRAIPRRALRLAFAMMAVGSAWAAWRLPMLRWLPALCCAAVAVWMARLPAREDLAGTIAPDPAPDPAAGPAIGTAPPA
jgi:uncharacterized membrane protein YbaN (DUF454 family)